MASLENVAEGFVAGRSSQLGHSKTQEPGVTANKNSARSSSSQTFEEVFLSHYARIVGILRRIVGDQARAEDLANEVFLKLHQHPAQTPESSVGGWLYRTATNLGIDSLRATARRSHFEQDAARQETFTASGNESGLDAALRHEREQHVRTVLADLKPAQAQLLLLRATGYSYKELASALELETGSIGTLLIRAEAAFEQRYLELFGPEEDL
jgi:RNA polymerase sigma-70 factor, ECF subfamily